MQISESGRLLKQLKELVRSGEELREGNFGKDQVKKYRSLYVECVESLAAHIGATKDKRLGEEAKELLHFNTVYRHMQLRIGLLAAGISLTFVLIVYLYMVKEMTALYVVSGAAALGAFFMIRYTSQFSLVLDKEVEKVNKVGKKLMRRLASGTPKTGS